MGKIFSQIFLLVAFVALAAFASASFQEQSNAKDGTASSTTGDLVQTFSRVWATLDSATSWMGSSSSSTPTSYNSPYISPGKQEAATAKVQDFVAQANQTANKAEQDMGQIDINQKKGDFQNFLGNILHKAPGMYVDTKIYNNGWREFWSFYWLKFKNWQPKQ